MKIELESTRTSLRVPSTADGREAAQRDDRLVKDLRLARESLAVALARTGRWPIPGLPHINDPDVRKYLNRLGDAFGELLRLAETGSLATAEDRRRAADLASELPDFLGQPEYEAARALYHEAQLLLTDVGDADVICGLVESERRWEKSTTSWLTWDTLYGNQLPKVLELHRNGAAISASELEAARSKLVDLYRARREDELVQRCRSAHRGRALATLSVVLAALLTAFLPVVWLANEHRPSIWVGLAVVLGGALGAAVAGTIRARDRLTLQSDLRRFRQEIVAQLLIGAVAAVVVYAILRALPITVSGEELDLDTLAEKLSFAFVAGFAEPFFIGTIERVNTLVDKTTPTTSKS